MNTVVKKRASSTINERGEGVTLARPGTGAGIPHGSRPPHFTMLPDIRSRKEESPAPVKNPTMKTADVICFSPFRWSVSGQRPQQLMSRCARGRRTFFVEEPVFGTLPAARLNVSWREPGVWVVVPTMPEVMSADEVQGTLALLLGDLLQKYSVEDYILWLLTAEALPYTRHLKPSAVVYDRMDELAGEGSNEQELLRRADLVFTNSRCGYDEQRPLHRNVHCFPCGADTRHFAQARRIINEPLDQEAIPHPRLGFFGVIDGRLDLGLLDRVAEARPDWHLVFLGPVTNVDAANLPHRPNVHYLGSKSYEELPAYLAGWDVAMLPLVRDDSTRRTSATRILEYLAAGRPVVTTSTREVVDRFADAGVVQLADTLAEFIIAAAEAGMDEMYDSESWQERVDALLATMSWESIWTRMEKLVEATASFRRSNAVTQEALVRPFVGKSK